MSGVNKVILIGRLGKDPDVKTIGNGSVVANFSIATSDSYKDKTTGEKKETTEWHNIVVWRSLAEIVQKYVHKGDMVYIEGKLRTRSWEKDGVTRYTTEIIADQLTMLGSKGSGSNSSSQPSTSQSESKPAAGTQSSFMDSSTDDLPF